VKANSPPEEWATKLAGQVMDADDHILLALVVERDGELLGKKASASLRDIPSEDEMRRRVAAFAVTYGAAEGATSWLGRAQYLTVAYEDYKVLVLRLPSGPYEGTLIDVRISRDVNAEVVYEKIISKTLG